MTKREFLDIVFALAPTEANAIMDAFDKYVDSNEPHWIPVDLENNEPQLEEWVLVSSDGYVMQDCIVERGGEKYGITAEIFRLMTDICNCPNLTRR